MRAFTGSSEFRSALDSGGLHAALVAARTDCKMTFPAIRVEPVWFGLYNCISVCIY